MISLSAFTNTPNRSMLGTLILDVLLSEDITLDGGVTLYPVEDGSLISDNIFRGAERVRLSGLVSADSIEVVGFSPPGKQKLVAAVDALREMHAARALITVSTGIQRYTDMGIDSLRATRTSDAGGGSFLSIQAELVKVRKVRLAEAEIPEATAQGAAKGRAGQTNTPAGKSSASSSSANGPASSSAQTEQAKSFAKKIGQSLGLSR
ncbi:phage baseplate protein [Teichococcus wenyumeiae]|nr:hypothetical protein [Pseudoroseomonas wenyumeiae]